MAALAVMPKPPRPETCAAQFEIHQPRGVCCRLFGQKIDGRLVDAGWRRRRPSDPATSSRTATPAPAATVSPPVARSRLSRAPSVRMCSCNHEPRARRRAGRRAQWCRERSCSGILDHGVQASGWNFCGDQPCTCSSISRRHDVGERDTMAPNLRRLRRSV